MSRRLSGLLAAGVLLAACTNASPPVPHRPVVTPSPTPPRPAGAPPPPDPLCRLPAITPRPTVKAGSLPPAIAEVARELEEVRGLDFTRKVTPEAVSQSRIGSLLRMALDRSYPQEMMDRRSKAWSTIGVIPKGTDLRKALGDFAGSQIIGFYDTQTHQLVFSGSSSPTPYQRTTLAHELTHALDDQHFDLGRLDELETRCQDEQLAALIGLAEGDAVTMSLRWAAANLTPDEMVQFQEEISGFPGPPPTVPEFVSDLFVAPYVSGPNFVESVLAKGGEPGLNRAFREPPVSTEQVMHPDRYPSDRPQAIDVPDVSEKLGGPWDPIDVYQVGEQWLGVMLRLRISDDQADSAAAGWDGGEYRAWANGDEVAVLLQTEWDTANDASAFAGAMERWIGEGTATVVKRGTFVQVLFGSDSAALRDLEVAAG